MPALRLIAFLVLAFAAPVAAQVSSFAVVNAETPGMAVVPESHLVSGRFTAFVYVSIRSDACRQTVNELRSIADVQPLLAVRLIDIDRPEAEEIDWQSPAARSAGLTRLPLLLLYDTRGRGLPLPGGLRGVRRALGLPLPPPLPAVSLLADTSITARGYLDVIALDPSAAFWSPDALRRRLFAGLPVDSIEVRVTTRGGRRRSLRVDLGGDSRAELKVVQSYDRAGRLVSETLDRENDGEADLVREIRYARGRVTGFRWQNGADRLASEIFYRRDARGGLMAIEEDLDGDRRPEISLAARESRTRFGTSLLLRLDQDSDSRIEQTASWSVKPGAFVRTLEEDANEDGRIDGRLTETGVRLGHATVSRWERFIESRVVFASEAKFGADGLVDRVRRDRDGDGSYDFSGRYHGDYTGRRFITLDSGVAPVAILASGAVRVIDAPPPTLLAGEPAEFLLDLDLPGADSVMVWIVEDTVQATATASARAPSGPLPPVARGVLRWVSVDEPGVVNFWRVVIRSPDGSSESTYYFTHPVEWRRP